MLSLGLSLTSAALWRAVMTRLISLIVALFLSTSAWAQVIGGGGALTVGVTPVLGTCTSGDFLYNNSGKLGCVAGGGAPGGSTLQLQYNNAGAFGGMAGTSWDDTNRSLTITGATVTTSNPVLNLSQTWNNAGVAFTGLTFDVTNTASAASSLLIDIKFSGLSKFRVDRAGNLTLAGGVVASSYFTTSNSSTYNIGPLSDTVIGRNAAASLRLGNADAAAPVAQTLGVQSVVAGTTDTAGVNWTLNGSTSTGAGVAGDIILQTGGTGAGATAQNAFVTALTVKGATQAVEFAKNATFTEMTAPSAPAANGATLYCDDNGAGKTRCSILFATGAAQQIAIEP